MSTPSPLTQTNQETDPELLFLFISSTITAAFFFSFLAYTLFKIRVHPYRPVIVVLISYGSCFMARLILDTGRYFISDNKLPFYPFLFLKIFNSVFDRVKWFSIFYFIFQAYEVYLKLNAT